jgi:hypothetical protein
MPRSGVFLLHEKSILGRVLHTLIGYTSQPAGIQVVFYPGHAPHHRGSYAAR